MKEHSYEYKEIVIGATLPGLLYAHRKGLPVFGFSTSAPTRLHEGGRSLSEWNKLIFVLSLAGQVPFSDNVETIDIQPNKIRLTTAYYSKAIEVSFETAHLFSDHGVSGLTVTKEGRLCEVQDWIDVRRMQAHDLESLEVDDPNYKIERILFKNIGRVDNPNRKDICAIFHIDYTELQDFENSPTMTRIEVERYLKQKGLHGGVKNKASETRKSPTYNKIVLESNFRKLIKREHNSYAPMTGVKDRLYSTVEDVLIETDGKIPPATYSALMEAK
tara:strand:+ start:1486 stop:2307 length:822 start_codon:yes stop_codon:yes gene_type:complete